MPTIIGHPWNNQVGDTRNKPIVARLDNGHFLITADADTDADGAPDARKIDLTGNTQTALGRDNGWKGGTDYVNARVVPYFVLPSNWKDVTGITCELGDIAKITYGNRSVYAIYADTGSADIIGEASIAVVETLGHNPWQSGRIRTGIEFGVTYEIVPGSANLQVTVNFETIQSYGRDLFKEAAPKLATGQETESPAHHNLFADRFAITGGAGVGNLIGTAVAEEDTDAMKFISFFARSYSAVREEVEKWFVGTYSNNAVHNGCVAHQVSCLKLCGLPYPDWKKSREELAAINVDYFVKWAGGQGWTLIDKVDDMLPGDVCVSGPQHYLPSLDHVYAFVQYATPGYAWVLHNQATSIVKRTLLGDANTGSWRFALRMPNR